MSEVTANPLRIDPTRTVTLRRQFVKALKQRFARVRAEVYQLVAKEDAFGLAPREPLQLNQRWRFQTNAEKLKQFREWLRQKFQSEVVGDNNDLWQKYVEQGFKRGAGRAFDDATRGRLKTEPLDFYRGSREQFLRSSFAAPVAVEKVEELASRVFTDLGGITEQTSVQMARTLADGLTEGKSPREVAQDLVEDIDNIGINRATTMARTEIVRAHAEGQLKAFKALGVERLGVMVEWLVTDDDRLCAECEAMGGTVMSLAEASGLIPMHPNCRCAFIPALGEDDDEEVTANAFCPTGQGGGVDPSCGSGTAAAEAYVKALPSVEGVSKWAGFKPDWSTDVNGRELITPLKHVSMRESAKVLAKETDAGKLVTLKPAQLLQLRSWQRTVSEGKVLSLVKAGLRKLGSGEKHPTVIEYNGKKYLVDGNTRATAAIASRKPLQVRVHRVRNACCPK